MTSTLDEKPAEEGGSRLGQVVSGRYRIEQLLGEGGMGAVYLAEHTMMRKRVALKLLHPEMSDNEEVLARFRREAEAAAQIEHPNVATATDFGQTEDGAFFLVLEYIEGTSLRDTLARGALSAPRAVHVTRQIALALERAHAAGIVHRDLKPENVMLVKRQDDADFVKVLDFGIAKLESAQRDGGREPLTRLGTILGTPEYMAPEQALGEAVTPAADLYALGVMLFEMLTGKHPFDAHDRMAVLSMHIVAPVPAMEDRAPEISVPRDVEAVVRQLLEKDSKARPSSARGLIELLDATETGRTATGTPSPAPASRITNTGAEQSGPWAPSDSFAQTSHGLPAVQATTSAKTLGPARISALLRTQPPLLWIAGGGGVLVLIVIVVAIVALRSSPSEGGAKGSASGTIAKLLESPPKTATPEKLLAASKEGPEALVDLAKDFPDDLAVARALALAYQEKGRTAEALKTARALVEKDPKLVDGELTQIAAGAATSKDLADEGFAALETSFGARGVDALIDMSVAKASPAKARAQKSLAKPEVRAHASPAASAYLDLKAAASCQAKHDVLDRAKEHGDLRSLVLLKPLKSGRGCGFAGLRDCWPCLRKDSALEDAIDAIEARSAK